MAYDFNDASSQYIDYGDTTLLDGLTTATFHAHVWLDDVTSDHYIIAKVDGSTFGPIFAFDDVHGGSGRTDTWVLYWKDASTTAVTVASATAAAIAGQWQIVTGTVDVGVSGVMDLWIDGVKDVNSGVDSSGSNALANNADPLTIGIHSNLLGSGQAMDGKIAEVSIWNRVLSDEEIGNLHSGYSPKFIPNGRIFYDPLINETNDVHGLVGTPTNTPVVSAHPRIINPSAQVFQFPSEAAGGSSAVHAIAGPGGIAGEGGIAGKRGGIAG